MQLIHQTVQVSYHYAVHFTQQLFACDNPLLRDVISGGDMQPPKKILCVVDRGVCQHHPDLLDASSSSCHHHGSLMSLVGPPLVVPGGECAKNDLTNVATIQEAIHQYGICRHSYVMAIGGGAVIDMVGYAAATAHRGVRFIRVPTTVLSQNDSGIGVKNSVNAFGKKNFLGTFAPPVAVLNDADFLTTLSTRDWRSGISEAIKVALLKDAGFFDFIEENTDRLVDQDMQAMLWLIYRCAQLHLDHIATSGDPFEFGSSRPLDFGHWAAHKLEQLSHYTLRHGEAVAIGIALDTIYSCKMGYLDAASGERVLLLLERLGFELFANALLNVDSDNNLMVLKGLEEFREHLGGQLTLTLLKAIGQGFEVHTMNLPRVIESIYELQGRHQQTVRNIIYTQARQFHSS